MTSLVDEPIPMPGGMSLLISTWPPFAVTGWAENSRNAMIAARRTFVSSGLPRMPQWFRLG